MLNISATAPTTTYYAPTTTYYAPTTTAYYAPRRLPTTLRRRLPTTLRRRLPTTLRRRLPTTLRRRLPTTLRRRLPTTLPTTAYYAPDDCLLRSDSCLLSNFGILRPNHGILRGQWLLRQWLLRRLQSRRIIRHWPVRLGRCSWNQPKVGSSRVVNGEERRQYGQAEDSAVSWQRFGKAMWTAEADELVHRLRPREVARLLGVSNAAAQRRRAALGLPPIGHRRLPPRVKRRHLRKWTMAEIVLTLSADEAIEQLPRHRRTRSTPCVAD